VTISLLEGDVATDKVTDIDGNAITSVTSNGGVALFTLKAGEKPTLRAVINAEGFVPTNQVLDLTNPDSTFETVIALTPVVQGAGVAVASEEATVTGGQVAAEETVKATEAEATAEVVVPVGTTMQDAAGNAVTGTKVTMKVETAGAVASETKAAVSDLIPAGLNDVTTGETARKPVAAANITMVDDKGNQIKKFSTPINVALSVAESTGVKTGDTLKVSSYDEATAKWTRDEFDATVGAYDATTKTFAASFKTDHLTLFTTTTNPTLCPTTSVLDISEIGLEAADRAKLAYGMFSTDGLAIRLAKFAELPLKAKNVGVAQNATGNVLAFYEGTLVFNSFTDVPAADKNANGELALCGYKLPSLAAKVTEAKATVVPTSVRVTFQCSNAGAAAATPLTGAVVLANTKVMKGNGTGAYSADLKSNVTYNLSIKLPKGFEGATTTTTLTGLSAATINTTTVAYTKQCNVVTGVTGS
jgi:hypothetical protein